MKCAIKSCGNYKKRGSSIRFFRFPNPKTVKYDIIQQWKKACGRKDLYKVDHMVLNQNYRICSEHFSEDDMLNKQLCWGSVPKFKLYTPPEQTTPADETTIEATVITADRFHSICRACLSDLNDTTFNINDLLMQKNETNFETAKPLAVNEIYSTCTSLQINLEDTLPKKLCKQCTADLIYAYDFINRCQKSENILQTIVNCENIKNTIKTEEPEEIELTEHVFIKKEFDSNPIENVTEFVADEPQTPKKSLIRFHHRVHTNKRSFKCKHCGKCFKQKTAFHVHTFSHTGKAQYSCKICQKKVKQSTHNNLRCTEEWAYVCKYCGKFCTTKNALIVHEKLHREKKSCKCNVCDLRFYFSKATRKKHMINKIKTESDDL